MKKIWISIISITVFLLIFFHFFAILRVDTGLGRNKIVLVRKVQNDGRMINFLLPKTENIIGVGDLIIHKDVRYLDRTFRELDNFANRVMGLPGDRVIIENKVVYNNDSIISIGNRNVYFKYRVSFTDQFNCKDVLSDFDFKYIKTLADGIACEIVTTPYNANKINSLSEVNTIRQITEQRNTNRKGFFPNDQFFAWNKDYMGPFYVPKKDSTVQLTPRNIGLYQRIIGGFENNDLIYNLAGITINGFKVDTYTLQKNYYFVVNDNRDIMKDSRHWGFVPKSRIAGKVIL